VTAHIAAAVAPVAGVIGRCGRCSQNRRLFDRAMECGATVQLCVRCYSRVEEARDRGTFVDLDDAIDNASDAQLGRFLAGGAP
jgi:hypothetical protein